MRKLLRFTGIVLGFVPGAMLIVIGLVAAYQLFGGLGLWIGLGAFPILAMGGTILLAWAAPGSFPWFVLILQVISFAGFALHSTMANDEQ